MIWKKVFPHEGGALRRFIRMRKDMFESSLQQQTETSFGHDISKNHSTANKLMRPLTLFDFRRRDDAADVRAVDFGSGKQGWRISDDEVIGGYSRATLSLMGYSNYDYNNQRNSHIQNTIDSDNDDDSSDSDNAASPSSSSSCAPFIRWEGNIDTRIGPKSRAKKSGFCAIRCPEFPLGGIPVGNKYNALEVRCRSDGRTYTLNLKVQTYFPDDLYQTLITVTKEEVMEQMEGRKRRLKQNQLQNQHQSATNHDDDSSDAAEKSKSKPNSDNSDGFVSVVLPFQDFLLTSHGMVKAQQRTLDGGIQLQHLGLTLMDGKDGPFTFDISKIRLVNFDAEDGVIVNDYDVDDDYYHEEEEDYHRRHDDDEENEGQGHRHHDHHRHYDDMDDFDKEDHMDNREHYDEYDDDILQDDDDLNLDEAQEHGTSGTSGTSGGRTKDTSKHHKQ